MSAATLQKAESMIGVAPSVRIRTASPVDYPAMVAVHNRVYSDYPETPEEWQRYDERHDPKIRWQRFLAEDATTGEVVGIADYGQDEEMYHPRKFNIGISVISEREGAGIGSALYKRLLDALTPFDPLLVRTYAREDITRGVRFLLDRGFVEEMREWESRLDLIAFDETPFAGARERVTAQGIVIKSLAELADDPERDHKFRELDWAIALDIPSPDTLTQPPFEYFHKAVLANPNFLPEGWFVALDGDRYVGESALWKSEASIDLEVGATGVLREYRRRGIAMALKLHAIAYAKSTGCPQIKTWNEQNNRAMLSINEALGFVKQPAWIAYAKVLKTEEEGA